MLQFTTYLRKYKMQGDIMPCLQNAMKVNYGIINSRLSVMLRFVHARLSILGPT